MGFHRGNKPSSTSHKAKPSLSSSSSGTAGHVAHQDYVMAQSKPKVSFVVADYKRGDLVAQLEDMYGIAADESVDTRASLYISRVQERFKLERLNSDRMKFQESS
ncbi:uncharacterized protein LOC129307376 [Prosopis cineraria]|uniref:uncharacterized protein LOC129307376 n=1 Tax=Prosopis cineraria TaxID=364024 RepID=UPI00240F057E|nr:uncharacterized protein LOC129307376 [Prosopis cineraria]